MVVVEKATTQSKACCGLISWELNHMDTRRGRERENKFFFCLMLVTPALNQWCRQRLQQVPLCCCPSVPALSLELLSAVWHPGTRGSQPGCLEIPCIPLFSSVFVQLWVYLETHWWGMGCFDFAEGRLWWRHCVFHIIWLIPVFFPLNWNNPLWLWDCPNHTGQEK